MRRRLSIEHKEKLAEGRRRRAKLEVAKQRAAVIDYQEWVAMEHKAYTLLLAARADGDMDEISAAQEEWHEALSLMPPMDNLPSDSTWRELRMSGEL